MFFATLYVGYGPFGVNMRHLGEGKNDSAQKGRAEKTIEGKINNRALFCRAKKQPMAKKQPLGKKNNSEGQKKQFSHIRARPIRNFLHFQGSHGMVHTNRSD